MDKRSVFGLVVGILAATAMVFAAGIALIKADPISRLTRIVRPVAGQGAISAAPLSRNDYIARVDAAGNAYNALVNKHKASLEKLPARSDGAEVVAAGLIDLARELDALNASPEAEREEALINVAVASFVACSRNVSLGMERNSESVVVLAWRSCQQALTAMEYVAKSVPAPAPIVTPVATGAGK